MKKVLMFLFICGLTMTLAASAFAAMLPIEGPFTTGSWAQRFQASGVGNFNQAAIWSLSGAGFEAPAFRNPSPSGWTTYDPSTSNAFAFGPLVNLQQFDIVFNGSQSSPLSFLFMASQDLTVRKWDVASWNGNGWSFRGATSNDIGNRGPMDPSAVPEPAAMSLLGLGLFGLAGFRKKVKK